MLRGLILVGALALSGCGDGSGPKLWTRDEIADIAEDVATDPSEMEARVATLTKQVSDLEGQVARQRELSSTQVDWSKAQADLIESLQAEVSRLGENERVWIGQIDYLRAHHNQPPMRRND